MNMKKINYSWYLLTGKNELIEIRAEGTGEEVNTGEGVNQVIRDVVITPLKKDNHKITFDERWIMFAFQNYVQKINIPLEMYEKGVRSN